MGDPKTHKNTHKADKDAQKSHMGVRKTLRRHDVNAQVETLHRLLNYHLPGDLALPVGHAAGARDFGPLTEDRVKKFQRDKKINFGTERYMSGVVDDATWSALTKKTAAVVTITAIPKGVGLSDWFDRKRPSFGLPPLNPSPLFTPPPYLTPPSPPPPTPSPSTPSPSSPNGLVLDSIQAQTNGQIQYGSPVALPLRGTSMYSLQLQIVAIILDRGNKDVFHNEIQFGFQYLENFGPGSMGAGSKRDMGFLAVLNQANILHGDHLPLGVDRLLHLDGHWGFGIQEQIAITNSLSNGSWSFQASGMPSVSLDLFHSSNDKHVLQLTGQGGLILEVDPPMGPMGSWGLKAGVGGALGVSYSYSL
jgi:hypothetical protein